MNVLFFSIVGLLWGGVWLPIKIAVGIMPPLLTAAVRLAIASLLAYALVRYQKVAWPSPAMLKKSMITGLIGLGLPWTFLFWGQQYVYPAMGSIMNSAVPLFVVIFSWMLFRDKEETGIRKILGVLFGIAGVIVIFYPRLVQAMAASQIDSDRQLLGMLALLMMAILYGLNLVLLKRWMVKLDPNMNLLVQSLISCLFLLLLSLACEWEKFGLIDPQKLGLASGCLLYLGIFGSFVALNLFLRLVNRIGPLKAGSVTYTIPIVAILIDWLYYHVWPAFNQIAGAAMIFLGLGIIHIKRFPKRRKKGALTPVVSPP